MGETEGLEGKEMIEDVGRKENERERERERERRSSLGGGE